MHIIYKAFLFSKFSFVWVIYRASHSLTVNHSSDIINLSAASVPDSDWSMGSRNMSIMYKRNIRQSLCFMALVMTILMLCSPFICPGYGSNDSPGADDRPTSFLADRQGSLQTSDRQFFFTVLSVQLALREIVPAQKVLRPARNRQNSLQLVHGILILCVSLSLFLYGLANPIGNKNRRISVVAFSIGGHAPPFLQTQSV
jgi:hypothetical protein